MIVEMLGAPGAGKTTLVPTVREVLRTAGYHADTVTNQARPVARRTALGSLIDGILPGALREKALWQVFYWKSRLARRTFIAEHAELVRIVRDQQARRPVSREDKRHSLYWLFHLMGYYEFLLHHREPRDAFILDEGFVHRVVQLFASAKEIPDEQAIRSYLDLVPRPEVVIHVMSPWEICQERVYARGLWSRYAGRPEDEVKLYIANAHEVVGMAAAYLRSVGWNLIEIDNRGTSPNAARSELADRLTHLLESDTAMRHGALAI